MLKFETDEFGSVEVRFAMLDSNGTDLIEGLEIKSLEDEFDLIEIYQYHNIDNLSNDEVEDLISQNM